HRVERLLGHGLPVGGGDALAHDPARDRDELVVDVADALGVDAAADIRHLLRTPRGLDELVEVAHGSLLGRSPPACGVGSLLGRAQATSPATAVQVAGDDTPWPPGAYVPTPRSILDRDLGAITPLIPRAVVDRRVGAAGERERGRH